MISTEEILNTIADDGEEKEEKLVEEAEEEKPTEDEV